MEQQDTAVLSKQEFLDLLWREASNAIVEIDPDEVTDIIESLELILQTLKSDPSKFKLLQFSSAIETEDKKALKIQGGLMGSGPSVTACYLSFKHLYDEALQEVVAKTNHTFYEGPSDLLKDSVKRH